MASTALSTEQIHERGPRFAIRGTVRQGEHQVRYTDTAGLAESVREEFERLGYYQIQVYPPAGSVDLGRLGRDRAEAKRALDEKTEILRAGVLRALEEGRAEAEVARTAGVDRMTVRKWSGK